MIEVLLYGSTERRLPDLLEAAGMRVTPIDGSVLAGLVDPTATQPDAIVLDLRADPTIPAEVALIRRQHPTTGIMLVASQPEPSLLLASIRAGVTEFVSEPLIQSQLELAIARISDQHKRSTTGQVFGFVGAKGGVGTTTAAVNVGAFLAGLAKPARATLIDLHRSSGDAGVFFDAKPRFSIVDALENTHRLDPTFFRGLVTEVAPNLDLLASSDRDMGPTAETSRIRAVIDFAATMYRYTVVDLPRSDNSVLDALDRFTAIVVVANQELATVRSATRLTANLRQRYGRDRVSVVLSRSDRQADIGLSDIERAIGADITHSFPSDYRLALQAVHKGTPLVLGASSELATCFERLALDLTGAQPEKVSSRGLGLFARLGQARRA